MAVTVEQRQTIRSWAGNCCEYCRISEAGRLSKFQIHHIVPVKHKGSDAIENLCLACLKCNAYKGPNVAALDPDTGEATKLYNPRVQGWDEHFQINVDATLNGLRPEGRATIVVLRINEESRVRHRQMAMQLEEYPCLPSSQVN